MYELLFGALVFMTVAAIGGSVLTGLAARERAVRARLEGQAESDRRGGKHGGPLLRAAGGMGRLMLPRGHSHSLGEQLARAGYYSRSAPAVFIGCKFLLLMLGAALSVLLLLPAALPLYNKILLMAAMAGILFYVPNFVVEWRRRSYHREVCRHLPDVIDLMEICVCSGMGLDMAWNMISDEIRPVSAVMADQMVLTNLEVHLGASRVTAIRNMARRTGSDDVASLSTLLAQSERFGTSTGDALRTFAKSMREERTIRAQEAAEKVAVKLLFPMILFIFPALLVVMAGPAAIRLFAVIGNGL